jgi:hypothetical protein
LCKIWYRKKIVCGGWTCHFSLSLTLTRHRLTLRYFRHNFRLKTRERTNPYTHTIAITRRPKAAFFSGVMWGLCQ